MKFAVISILDKQYKVSEGEVFVVDALGKDVGNTFKAEHVLLYSDEQGAKIGKPYLSDCEVLLRVNENGKGKKISVRRFKAKSRYRRNKGHRQPQSTVIVERIVSKSDTL